MAVKDFLAKVGTGLEHGLETTGRVAGAVLPTLGRAIIDEESGQAPEIAAEKRAHAQKLEDAALAQKEQELTQQLELGRKYGTLTQEQQSQYVDAITKLYSNPRHAGTLMEKLRKAVHPDGMVAGPAPKLASAIPEGGTAAADEANAEKLAAAKYHAKPLSPNAAFFDSYARKKGYADTSEMTPEDWEAAIKEQKTAGRAPVKWSPVHFNGNFYVRNPETNEMKFIGTEANTTVRHGTANITVGEPPHLIQIPTTTYVSKVSGQPIVDEEGSPYEAQDESKGVPAGASPTDVTPPPPKPAGGANKPSVGTLLSGSPKTGAKPVSPKPHTTPKPHSVASAMTPPNGVGNLPRGSRDLGQKGPGLLEKSDIAQYTKVAEDANQKKEAYDSATKAIKEGSTPSSNQELIYAWVRSNVQGAGRMTQAEFKQAASIGSLPQRAQNWYSMSLNGTLDKSIQNMMMADIKRSYETAQSEADELRKRVQNPSGTPSTANDIDDQIINALRPH